MSQLLADFRKVSEDVKEITASLEKDTREVLLQHFREVVEYCVPILVLENEKYLVPTGERDQMGNMKYLKYSLNDPALEQGDFIPRLGTLELYKRFKVINGLLLMMFKTYKNDLEDMNKHILDLKEDKAVFKKEDL